MTTKIKKQKAKVSDCCGAQMIGGVQCENCGSNGKFTSNTAIVRKLEAILKAVAPTEKIAVKAPEQTTDERFIDCGDGTIKDTKTGLMWVKEGSKDEMKWDDANNYCKGSELGGYSDWRLPTRLELESILDLEKYDPAINPIFKCESAGYWTSTIYASSAALAWVVNFYYGSVSYSNRYYAYYVRPVRQY